jgi:glycosyltransferase involved in cell wall biosynthesis
MIAPRIGGLPEAIVHGETGLLFPIGDLASMTDCLRAVTERPESAARMGGSARDKILRNFTFEKMVTNSERVLAESLSMTAWKRTSA